MQQDLENYGIKAHVMYDWATDKFKWVDINRKAQLYEKYVGKNFIQKVDGKLIEWDDWPLLIMSSTSFTEDENFMVMIEGLDYVQSMI